MVNPLEAIGVPGFLWDIIAMIITFFATICVILLVGVLYRKGRIRDDMLIVTNHVYVAPAATVTWLLYSNEIQSRFLAAVTPLVFSLIFIGILGGRIKNEKFVRMLTTSEDLTILRAPLIYSLVITVLTILGWPVPLDNTGAPIYMVMIPTMLLVLGPWTGGWGMGHFVNRKYGKSKLRVPEDRSIEGAVAMFVFSIISCYLLLGLFWVAFYWQFPSALALSSLNLLLSVAFVSFVATIIEIASPSIYDNAIIPIGILVTLILLASVGIHAHPIFSL